MKKNQNFFRLIRFSTACFSFAAAIALNQGVSAAEQNCQELLKERCASCHYLTRVCDKVEREMNTRRLFGSAEGTWRRSVRNMVKQGAKLNEKEEELLVQCLSKPTGTVLTICELKK